MTLVEVLLALSILSVGLIAFAAALPLGTSYITQSNLDSTALFLAQQRLEEIRSASWTSAPPADCVGVSASATSAPVTGSWTNCPGTAPAGLVTYPDEAYGSMTGSAGYRRTTRIIDCVTGCAGVTDTYLRQMTVTVFFRPAGASGALQTAQEQGVQLTSLKAKRQ